MQRPLLLLLGLCRSGMGFRSLPAAHVLGRRHPAAAQLHMSDSHEYASGLPIAALLPEVVSSLRTAPNLVLEAPPGAGKTTTVPLALLRDDGASSWCGGGDGLIMVRSRPELSLGTLHELGRASQPHG